MQELLQQVQTTRSQTVANFGFLSFVLIFIIQSGFMVVESGAVRAKNVRMMIIKNYLVTSVGAGSCIAILHSLSLYASMSTIH